MPILIPFVLYTKPMLDCESMKVSAMVTNKMDPDQAHLAKDNVVLVNPPISVTVSIFWSQKNENIYFVHRYKFTLSLVHTGHGSA